MSWHKKPSGRASTDPEHPQEAAQDSLCILLSPWKCLCRSETPLSVIPVPGMAKPSPPKALSKNNQAEADTEHGKF